MDKNEWLKAIKCSKEELIDWLNEMYEDEERLKKIITEYEKNYDVKVEDVQEEFYDPLELGRNREMIFYTKVKAKNFEYRRNW